MKIRTGFVSNSSSSSFIVALDPDFDVKDVDAVKELLWPGEETVRYCHDWGSERTIFNTRDLAAEVVGELKLIDLESITEKVADGHFPGYPEQNYSGDSEIFERMCSAKERGDDVAWQKARDELDAIWATQDAEIKAAAAEYASPFLAANSGKVLYHAEFHDDCRIGSHLEHGGTFDLVPHIRISHH